MKILEDYLLERETALNRILQKKPGSYSKSTFHVFRVEIKKLNALFGIVDYCIKGFKKGREFRPFRLIFRQAGKVRAIQIEESILKPLSAGQPIPDYLNDLRLRRLEEQRLFYRLLKVIPPGRLEPVYTGIKTLLPRISEKQAEKYLVKSSRKISGLINKLNYSEIQIHTLRKMVKSHDYLADCLKTESLPAEKDKKPDLSNLLGKWHDRILIINNLESARAQDPVDPAESEWLGQAKSALSAELEILTEKIRTAVQSSGFIEIHEIERID